MKIITAKEMSALDASSLTPPDILMERAGRGLALAIEKYFPELPVVIVCGKGNNGGDGLVAARYLLSNERRVKVFLLNPIEELAELSQKNAGLYEGEFEVLREVAALEAALTRPAIAVDCIFGTGFRPPLGEDVKNILEIISENSKIILACDIPSGVSGDTGIADEDALKADLTVTFEYPKIGHIADAGATLTGSLEVIPIGIGLSPEKYFEDAELTGQKELLSINSRRRRDTHKKTFGHTLIVGASPGMSGAVIMAARGALRSGAGLVTCAVPKGLSSEVAAGSLSSMELLLDEDSRGQIRGAAADKVIEYINSRNVDAVLIGPGLGAGDEVARFIRDILSSISKRTTVVLDADALNSFRGKAEELRSFGLDSLILTPHPGEMGRLISADTAYVQKNRITAAEKLSKSAGAIVLLKGYRSIISGNGWVYINPTGNAGMSTGGSGDVLAGMIASLCGQGYDALSSALTACWMHGKSADIAAWSKSESFILPEEIIENLWRV